METKLKLKKDAIERRIAELKNGAPDAKTAIHRLEARIKTYPQEPKKRIYKVKTRFIFSGTFGVRATSQQEAIKMVKTGCGMNIGEIHTHYGDDINWRFDCKPDKIVCNGKIGH